VTDRTVHISPEFFDDHHVAALSIEARYLLIGLMGFANSDRWVPFCEPAEIVGRLYRHTDGYTIRPAQVERWLRELKVKQWVIQDRGRLRMAPSKSFTWHGRGPLPKLLVRKVLFRDEKCQMCGTTEKLSVDHIWPRIYGGSNDLDNLQALCRSCNSKKGFNLRVDRGDGRYALVSPADFGQRLKMLKA